MPRTIIRAGNGPSDGARNAIRKTYPSASRRLVPSDNSMIAPDRPSIAKPSGPMRTGCKSTLSGLSDMKFHASSSAPDLTALFQRTAWRYRDCGRFARNYVAAKLHRDPVNREILSMAAKEQFGDVVDIGCGRGQLGVALLEAG